MMRHAILLMALLPCLRGVDAYAQQTLAAYQDRSRVLLLFAESAKNPVYQEQLGELARHAAELHERDVVVLSVLTDAGLPVTPETLRVIVGPGLPEREQMLVRRRFAVPATGFTVLLIGKDGGEKLRSQKLLPFDTLRRTIDAMPMRQQEMRDKAQGR